MKRILLMMFLLTWCANSLAVTFMWQAPTHRENGEVLKPEEIALYEFVGRDASGKKVWGFILKDSKATSYLTDVPKGVTITQYEIGVADTNGLYSEFVPIKPIVKILPPTEGEIF